MSTNILDFPVEIFSEIAINLEKKDNDNLIIVCKDIYKYISALYYSNYWYNYALINNKSIDYSKIQKLVNYNNKDSNLELFTSLRVLSLMSNSEMSELPETVNELYLGWNTKINSISGNIKKLHMGCTNDEFLEKYNLLSTNIIDLTLSYNFNNVITKNSLPKFLKRLVLGNNYNCVFEPGVLPETLEYLEAGKSYNQPFDRGVLPSSLKCLVLSYEYNQEFKPGVLPIDLTKLVLGYKYNSVFDIGSFPDTLTTLIFGCKYKHPFKPHVLPTSLTYLDLGIEYNQVFEPGVLPVNLDTLILGYFYNQPFGENVLPDSTQVLQLASEYSGGLFSKQLPPNLPSCLRILKLPSGYTLNNALPSKISITYY